MKKCKVPEYSIIHHQGPHHTQSHDSLSYTINHTLEGKQESRRPDKEQGSQGLGCFSIQPFLGLAVRPKVESTPCSWKCEINHLSKICAVLPIVGARSYNCVLCNFNELDTRVKSYHFCRETPYLKQEPYS